jgi:hypothetical protein
MKMALCFYDLKVVMGQYNKVYKDVQNNRVASVFTKHSVSQLVMYFKLLTILTTLGQGHQRYLSLLLLYGQQQSWWWWWLWCFL